MSQKKESRLIELDALRGLAALSVVFFHYTATNIGGVVNEANWCAEYMKYGVQLFFGISGFVIIMSLEKCQRPSEFIISRLSRLYPTFWFCVTLTWIWVWAVGPRGFERGGADYLVSMTMNLYLLNSLSFGYFVFKPVDGVYWTLQYELFFYAIMLFIFVAKLLRRVCLWSIAWSAIGLIVFLHLLPIQLSKVMNLLFILTWADFFIVGAIVYKMSKSQSNDLALKVTLAAVVALHAIKFGSIDVSVLMVVTALLCGASLWRWKVLQLRPLIFLGTISYPLYLVHESIGWSIIMKFDQGKLSRWLSVPLVTLMVIVISWFIHRYVELPWSRWAKNLLSRCERRVAE